MSNVKVLVKSVIPILKCIQRKSFSKLWGKLVNKYKDPYSTETSVYVI